MHLTLYRFVALPLRRLPRNHTLRSHNPTRFLAIEISQAQSPAIGFPTPITSYEIPPPKSPGPDHAMKPMPRRLDISSDHSTAASSLLGAKSVRITFIDLGGKHWTTHTYVTPCQEEHTLLSVAQDNDLAVTGECGGMCSCRSCHMVVERPKKMKQLLGRPETLDEEGMLKWASNKEDASRLGCQVRVTAEMDGLVVKLVDAYVEEVRS